MSFLFRDSLSCENTRKKQKEKRRYPTSVSVDRNGAASWGDKEDGELSDRCTLSTLSAATDDEDRLTINVLAEEGQTNPNQQSDEAQPAAHTTNAKSADKPKNR